jgi:pimeloyl-ACP methyl ester carboxylesterase
MADATDLKLVKMESGHKLNVHYLKCQKSCETTFFFIHGSMGSLQQFDDIIAMFKNKVNIVAYDVMGCGGSEKPAAEGLYSTKSLTSNSIEVFEKYATTKNVLIGHSYGTAQIARLCSHISRQRKDSDSKDLPVRTISGVILLGTVDVLPESVTSTVCRLFSLPIFLLSPMSGWMSRSYVGLAYSPLSNPSLKERAIVRAGKSCIKSFLFQQVPTGVINELTCTETSI